MISAQTYERASSTGVKGISRQEALEMIQAKGKEIEEIIQIAKKVRHEVFGNRVKLCSIVNAKSGHCPEYCAFCSQSRHFKTASPVYPLKTPQEILDCALRAESIGACEFSIVTSGKSVNSKNQILKIKKAIELIKKNTNLSPCASLGELNLENIKILMDAGLECYHHNIETAPSFHPKIVLTHTFLEEVKIIEQAKDVGLKTCCGGILGMGETFEQIVEFLFAIKDIDPDYIPLNFLNPIPGTPLENLNVLTPIECLKIIAVTRLVLPQKHIVICGGREKNLKDLQCRMFDAGASATMIGDYLTTKGQSPEEDHKMIKNAGYIVVNE